MISTTRGRICQHRRVARMYTYAYDRDSIALDIPNGSETPPDQRTSSYSAAASALSGHSSSTGPSHRFWPRRGNLSSSRGITKSPSLSLSSEWQCFIYSSGSSSSPYPKSCLQSPQIFSTTLSRFAPARIVPFSLEKVFRSFCPFDGFVEPFPSVV